ncbi:MAG: asparaginase [Gammaproteobacteria bacterium]|nr:asparaginase [Gammaproteobacteria bacterium]
MKIKIFTTGGTFDKIYFDAKSEFHFADTIVGDLLEEANICFDYDIVTLFEKDSLDIDDVDRKMIHDAVDNAGEDKVLISHGTDTMVETAQALLDIGGKTIVLFGAMRPARMRQSDATYNLGVACAAVQLLPAGVHLAMNGQIFDPRKAVKNRALNRFERTDS